MAARESSLMVAIELVHQLLALESRYGVVLHYDARELLAYHLGEGRSVTHIVFGDAPETTIKPLSVPYSLYVLTAGLDEELKQILDSWLKSAVQHPAREAIDLQIHSTDGYTLQYFVSGFLEVKIQWSRTEIPF